VLQLTVPLNASRGAKNVFVAERLLPYLRDRGVEHYVTRRVMQVPVAVAYIKEGAAAAPSVREEVQRMLDAFVADQPPEELVPAADYEEMWGDISKIHRLDGAVVAVDRVVECVPIRRITRSGAYYRPEDAEIYTHFLFAVQPLMQRTLAYLEQDRARRETPFLVGLFLVTSRLFRIDGEVRGHFSFKSHVLGFFSHPHELLPAYAARFQAAYVQASDALDALRRRVEADDADPDGDPLVLLLRDWDEHLHDLQTALFAVRDVRQRSVVTALRAQVDYLQFRRLSSFHAKAFGRRGQRTISSRAFGAYRMCVNFVYLVLPALGLSSRKRVLAGYLLVRTFEKQHDFLDEVVGR